MQDVNNENDCHVTAAPVPAENSQVTATPESSSITEPDIFPAVTPAPTATPLPSVDDSVTVVADIWLLFGISQDELTPDTKQISGIMHPYKDTTMEITLNGKSVGRKVFEDEVSEFVMDVDFSQIKPNSEITITRSYNGDRIISDGKIETVYHSVVNTYVIVE